MNNCNAKNFWPKSPWYFQKKLKKFMKFSKYKLIFNLASLFQQTDKTKHKTLQFHIQNCLTMQENLNLYRDLRVENFDNFRIFKEIFVFHLLEINSLFFPPALLDLPRGLLKCVMFRKAYGCPHEDIQFILYTP